MFKVATGWAERVNVRRILPVIAAVASAVAITAPVAAAPTHHTGLGIALTDASAGLVKDPRAHVYVIDHVQPGASFTRHLEVINDTGGSVSVKLYPDAAKIAHGAFVPLAGASPNPLTSWIRVSPAVATLTQGQRLRVTATFDVPSTASIGENYAAIFAEMGGQQVPGGFAAASRVGVRVYLYVGSGAAPRSDFRITTLTPGRSQDGHPVVEATVVNTGQRALDMFGRLWLRNGPGGVSAGPFAVRVGTTLGVGDTEPVSAVLDKALPAGPWLAHLELQSDLIKHAVEATITFPATSGTAARPVAAKPVPLSRNRNVLVPIAGGLALALLVGLILLALWKRRRREDDRAPELDQGALPDQRRAASDRIQT